MTIKVGIIGTGFAKSVQIPGFQNSKEYEVVAIYGRTVEKAEKIAQEFNIPTVHEAWEDLISDENVDLVSVVSPVFEHYPMAMGAILNQKHILLEKPMAFDVEEAFSIQQELAHTGKIGMINHEFRQLPERRYFHDLVQSGELGEIYEINIDMSSSGRLPKNTSDRTHNWWADQHYGGGLWGALGSHLIDFILWTFGSIEKITGTITTNNRHLKDQITGQSRLVTSDDAFSSLFVTSNGIHGRLNGSTVRHGESGTVFEAYGSKAAMRIDRDRKLWRSDGDGWKEVEIPDNYKLRELKEDEPWLIPPFEVLISHLAEGIKQSRNPSPSFEDGLNVQYVLDALRQSNLDDRWIII